MNIVKELRRKKGIQQKELALSIGVSRPIVSEWESGKKDPSGERLRKLAEYFEVDELVILGKGFPVLSSGGYFYIDKESGKMIPVAEPIGIEKPPESVRIYRNAVPIVGNIACSPQTVPDANPDGFADLPEGIRADFALKCKGDSMSPMFNDGDLVLIRQQPEVENGQIAAVSINGETTLKHVYRNETGLLLCANNTKYAPIQTKPGDDVLVFGLAVGFVRMF